MKRNTLAIAISAVAATLSACVDSTPTAPPAVVAAPQFAVQSSQEPVAFLPSRVIVRFRQGADAAQVARGRGVGLQRKLLLDRLWVVEVPAGSELAMAQQLAADPNVEFAEPDYLFGIVPCEVGGCDENNDGFREYRWDLHNKGFHQIGSVTFTTGKPDADIDWLELYDYLGPAFSGSARIGIIDTGIRDTHQDLAGKVIAKRNFATGYASDFTDDRDSHGTHVAGIAAGLANNSVGTAGVAWGVNIKLINAKSCERYLFPDGTTRTSCPSSSTADAIVWAVDQGANVLNLSLGGAPNAPSGSALQQAALQYARSKNVLPFCATGNDNFPGIAFPARFAECVAVGATNWSDERASYSNYGAEIEISAPGGQSGPTSYGLILSPIYSASNPTSNTTYGWKAGTSMATPQAVGLAALLYATGMTSADAVLARMKQTADDLGPAGWDPQFGAGRINAYRAVTGQDPNAPPVAVIAGGGTITIAEGQTITLDGSGSYDPNGKPVTLQWTLDDGNTSTAPTVTRTYTDDGSHVFSLTVTDAAGLRNTTTTTVVVTNVAPLIGAVMGATLLRGETYSAAGSFADPGADSWSATVNYGDGSGVKSLSLTGKSFVLTHTYMLSGTFSARVTVTDDDGGAGTATAVVTVLTPQQSVQSLVTLLSGDDAGIFSITGATASSNHSLRVKLEAAVQQLDKGNLPPAMNQIEAFMNQVRAMMQSDRTAEATGQRILDAAARVLRSLTV